MDITWIGEDTSLNIQVLIKEIIREHVGSGNYKVQVTSQLYAAESVAFKISGTDAEGEDVAAEASINWRSL